MKYQHVDPEEAVRIHIDVQTKKSVAIHWGTFALANEVSDCDKNNFGYVLDLKGFRHQHTLHAVCSETRLKSEPARSSRELEGLITFIRKTVFMYSKKHNPSVYAVLLAYFCK